MLNLLDNPLIIVDAIDQVPKGVPANIYNKIQSLNQSRTGGLAFQLHLKIGAKVMLTSNIDIGDKLINGQIGTIAHITEENMIVKIIYVVFDNENVGMNKMKSDRCAKDLNAVPIERVTTDIRTNEKKLSSPIIKRTQFPLMLSWGCTVHKVQGLSLDKIVVSFELLRQRAFNSGQIYVALSRVTSLEGLFLIGKYNPNAICVDKKAVQEYQYLREHQSFNLETEGHVVNSSFSFVVCNVRSLQKHFIDLSADKKLITCDVIFCTETQLLNENVEIPIESFNITFNNDDQHKYSSLAAYYKNDINLVKHFKHSGFSVLEFEKKNNLFFQKFKVLMLYRKQDFPTAEFMECLQYFSIWMDVDIIVGDFNMPPNLRLEEVLSEYCQIVSHPTHLGGAILDHVYVKRTLYEIYNVVVKVKSIFFSDHEAIKVSLILKSNS